MSYGYFHLSEIFIDFSNDPFSDLIFDEIKILDLLKRTNVNKAYGPDGINSKLVKLCAKGLAKPLAILFNQLPFPINGNLLM